MSLTTAAFAVNCGSHMNCGAKHDPDGPCTLHPDCTLRGIVGVETRQYGGRMWYFGSNSNFRRRRQVGRTACFGAAKETPLPMACASLRDNDNVFVFCCFFGGGCVCVGGAAV